MEVRVEWWVKTRFIPLVKPNVTDLFLNLTECRFTSSMCEKDFDGGRVQQSSVGV